MCNERWWQATRSSLIAALACAGCVPTIPLYSPSSYQSAILDRAHDAHAAALIGSQGVDFQGAYALTDEVGVTLSGGSSAFADKSGWWGTGMTAHTVSGGLVWSSRPSRSGPPTAGWEGTPRPALSVDLGLGTTRGTDTVFAWHAEDRREVTLGGRVVRARAQGQLGFEGANAGLLFVGRVTYLGLTHASWSELAGQQAGFTFFEPGIVVRVGSPSLKVEAQAGWSMPLLEHGATDYVLNFPLLISIGLSGELSFGKG